MGKDEWSVMDIPGLAGKVALVTGGNTGIGFEVAKQLAAKGATVTIASRSKERVDKAISEIKVLHPDAKLCGMVVDLASLSSIKAFVEEFKASNTRLDLLVDNAGVFTPPANKTADGFDIQLGTNHFGTSYLTQLLLPLLLASTPARIVVLSSMMEGMAGGIDWEDLGGEKLSDTGTGQYATSKLFNGLYARALAMRYNGKGLAVFAVHPGFVATEIQEKSAASCLKYLFSALAKVAAIDPPAGAVSSLFTATAPLAGEGGSLHLDKGALYGPDSFNRGLTAARPFGNKQYTDANATRLHAETLRILEAKGFKADSPE